MIYITSDIHGDIKRFSDLNFKKIKDNDTLIICGDFGFIWNNSIAEKRALRKLSRKKFDICFVDGANENFNLLNRYKEKVWNGGKVHQINKNIFHLMRGQIFNIENMKIFTFGGGESADVLAKRKAKKWWKEEMPSPEQFYEGAKNIDKAKCEVDLIITHEPPTRIKGMLKLEETLNTRVSGINNYFENLSQACNFKHWYFGAMHCDQAIPPKYTAVFKNVIAVDDTQITPKTALPEFKNIIDINKKEPVFKTQEVESFEVATKKDDSILKEDFSKETLKNEKTLAENNISSQNIIEEPKTQVNQELQESENIKNIKNNIQNDYNKMYEQLGISMDEINFDD